MTFVGDLANGRTVHSLARLLTHYVISLRFVSPQKLKMPDEVKSYVRRKGIQYKEISSLEEVLPETDVLYMTRIQRERFDNEDEYRECCGHYVITPQLMTRAKTHMIVMHPLPRLNEIQLVVMLLCYR